VEEETGYKVTTDLISLTEIKQKGGKRVLAWAAEGDFDPSGIKSNTFSMEWPPRSGKMQEFPEVDKAEWFSVSDAKQKINANQGGLIQELMLKLNISEVTEQDGQGKSKPKENTDKEDDSQQSLF
jgi:predicted NUDIX family NTP pyrophosphohydrolase